MRLSFFFIFVLLVSGCTESDIDTNPKLLSSFFIPIPGSSSYDWTHLDQRPDTVYRDSLYSVAYIGHDVKFSIDGLTPVSLFQVSTVDTNGTKTVQNEYYVSDSMIIGYGTNALSDAERMVFLRDPLEVGKSWLAAEKYRTLDGILTQIGAIVDAYYSVIHIGNKDYSDVYRITYYPSPSALTVDAAYTDGARHVHYYANGVGKVLEMVYAPDSSLVWKNELVREH
jgi:hypothetical protein